jgi:hypothetical protein
MNRWQTFVAALCVATLPGCVAESVKGAREYAVGFQATSAKTTDEIVRCIIGSWERYGTRVQYLPGKTGATISVTQPPILLSPALYLVFVDIEERDAKREVTLRLFRSPFGGAKYRQQHIDEVAACL